MSGPHSLSSKERELSKRDGCIQVRGNVRRGVTQSLVEHALTAQSTRTAIYSLHLARRTTRLAENLCGGKSGQPRRSQPRQNLCEENPHCVAVCRLDSITCAAENLCGEKSGHLVYSRHRHRLRRELLPAESLAGGKSGHPVQPRYNQPR